MSGIHIFVISWSGQHERAAAIAGSLAGQAHKLSIVYSDPNGEPDCLRPYHLLRRDDKLFWSDKFKACLDECAASDIMLIIHADCSCSDWAEMLSRCRAAFVQLENMAVWAPRLTGTPWRLEGTRMRRIAGTQYSIVAHTDGIVFALNPVLYPRMKQANYRDNLYGLGIDWLFICAAHANGMNAITDEGVTVHHPISRGYCSEEAQAHMDMFMTQLREEELEAYIRLSTHINRRRRYTKLLWRVERYLWKVKRADAPSLKASKAYPIIG